MIEWYRRVGTTMRGATMADELVGQTLVVVHQPSQPALDEWAAHCAGIVESRAQICGVIVLAHGAGPDARQRRELQEAWGAGTPPPVAIVTASTLIRGVLTALNWFMANRLKPFAPTDFAGALAYARVPEHACEDVLRAMRKHADALGVPMGGERTSVSPRP